MRIIALTLALSLTPRAEAGAPALGALIGTVAGGLVGGAVGAPVYGAIDPYGSDDALEWVLVGLPMGFGAGAALGGTIGHALFGGGRTWTVGLIGGGLAVAGGTLLYLSPRYYREGSDPHFVWSMGLGWGLSVVATPVGTVLASMLAGGRRRGHAALVPTLNGAALVGRF